MKVALVYDRVNKWGGAERVLLALHKIFPKAPLYTSLYNPKTAPWAKEFIVKTSFLQKIPYASSHHEFFAPFMFLAFQSFSFKKYDLVISVTSEAAKSIKVRGKALHVCYCLTPTRYLWSGYKEYFRNDLFRLILKPLVYYLRFLDKNASKNPDVYIAISQEVRKRIEKYYQQDAKVIYPPVELKVKKYNGKKKHLANYFLVVSRLVAYKRIDVVIEACNRLKLPLVIVGKGVEEEKLKAMAGQTIIFVKNLTDQELVEYYKNCRALIFAGREDFGIAIVEAQSFGKPVIAFRGGGAMETVVEGKTGVFFSSQRVSSLISVLNRFDERKYKPNISIKNSKRFSEKRFKKEIMEIMKSHKKKL